MKKYIVNFLIVALFLSSNVMAAKIDNSYSGYGNEAYYDSPFDNDELYVDYTQRTPFFEEEAAMQMMSGPPGGQDPWIPPSAPVPGGLLAMLGFAGAYAVRLYRKRKNNP